MNTRYENQPSASAANADTRARRTAGIAIAVSAITSTVFVALDQSARGRDALSILQSMVAIQPMHQFVHVVAITCLTGLMFGYTVLSRSLGLHRTPVLLALISYAAGTGLMLLAAVIDGFVSTDTAVMFVGAKPEVLQTGYWIINTLSGVMLPDLARVAWVFQSVAALAWSWALLQESGLSRRIGVVGLLAGGLPAVIVSVVGTAMTDTVVVGILLAQGVWNLAAALWLLLKRDSTEARVSNARPALATQSG